MKDSIPFENQARECVRWIEDRIKAALAPAAAKAITAADKARLERELDSLRPAFENLTNLFLEPLRDQKPDLCSFGYCELRSLMWAAFNAGARSIVSNSAKQYTFNEKTQNARDVRAQKKNPEIEARRNAVKAEIEANRGKRQPAGSDDYANFILEGVERRMLETYPKAKTASVSTVRNDLREYLKGFGKPKKERNRQSLKG